MGSERHEVDAACTQVPATPRSSAVSSCQSSAVAWFRSPSTVASAWQPTYEHERALASQVVQPVEVAPEVAHALEVHVEGQEVDVVER